jgi:hypothetical protein
MVQCRAPWVARRRGSRQDRERIDGSDVILCVAYVRRSPSTRSLLVE